MGSFPETKIDPIFLPCISVLYIQYMKSVVVAVVDTGRIRCHPL